MPSNYTIIGGAAYQPGSAAARRAQQLQAGMPSPAATPNIFAPPAPRITAPVRSGGQTAQRFDRWFDQPPGTTTQSAQTPASPMNTIQGTPGAGGAIPDINFPNYPGTVVGGSSPGAGTAPNLTPAPGMGGMGAFGLVPQVPNPVGTAGTSITGNTSNLPALGELGTGTTKLAANLGALPYQANLPNYAGMVGQSSQNILSNLEGKISPATWDAIQQGAAERGARTGIGPGSPNFDTSWMRALGQTAEQEQALGEQQLSGAIARTPTGQPFNIAGQQISPGDTQAAQYAANVAGAAPDPTQAAQANLDMLLKSIEAGRAGGLGGVGGGGGSGYRPGPTAPGARGLPYMPVGPAPGVGGPGSSYAPRPSPVAPGTVSPAGQDPNVDYSVQPSGQQYPTDLSGDPYWAQFANPPASPGDIESQPVAPETGTPAYAGNELDPVTQEFLQQFGIDWSLPDYGSYDASGG